MRIELGWLEAVFGLALPSRLDIFGLIAPAELPSGAHIRGFPRIQGFLQLFDAALIFRRGHRDYYTTDILEVRFAQRLIYMLIDRGALLKP